MEKQQNKQKVVTTLFLVKQNENSTEVEVEGSGEATIQAMFNEYPKAKNTAQSFSSGDRIIHLGFRIDGKFKEPNQYPTTGRKYYEDTYYWYSNLNQTYRRKWQK